MLAQITSMWIEKKIPGLMKFVKKKKRYIFLRKLNLFRQNKNFESRVAMTRARSDYKRVIRQARYDYDTHKTLRLEQAQCFYAKLYLKKKLKKNRKCKHVFYYKFKHFRKIF